MALLTIREFPDTILKKKSQIVTVFDRTLQKIVNDMLDTMYDAPGVGLAANQIGIAQRIIVIDASFSVEQGPDDLLITKNQNPQIFINPELITKSGNISYSEGCLSVPGVTEPVSRSKNITLKYQDVHGTAHEMSAQDFLAVILQHEIDHLEGRLFIDRLSTIKKSVIVGKIKKGTLVRRDKSRLHVDL